MNGRRKMGYALGWMMRPGVETQRRAMHKRSLFELDPAQRLELVEMPVLSLHDHEPREDTSQNTAAIRIGIGGYAQQWSVLPTEHLAHKTFADAGYELHALLPQHWAAGDNQAPPSALPATTIMHRGPLQLLDFHRWVRSMDLMVDVFPQSSERRLAMITRSAIALGWGVPVVHGVDSEVADIIREYDAGWVETSLDPARWRAISEEIADPAIRLRKRQGANAAQRERFEPHVALAAAASSLKAL